MRAVFFFFFLAQHMKGGSKSSNFGVRNLPRYKTAGMTETGFPVVRILGFEPTTVSAKACTYYVGNFVSCHSF